MNVFYLDFRFSIVFRFRMNENIEITLPLSTCIGEYYNSRLNHCIIRQCTISIPLFTSVVKYLSNCYHICIEYVLFECIFHLFEWYLFNFNWYLFTFLITAICRRAVKNKSYPSNIGPFLLWSENLWIYSHKPYKNYKTMKQKSVSFVKQKRRDCSYSSST